uniref:Uncharacterized protein n=1 Tax=Pyrodinium bahamense TaxID=73915 RepID=A0A7S0FY30_9DINO|mmetsp:Transcript_7157/g.19893  ORF Transcript_7157/g.19893 Transcript_7157/m.19893 type:complete len:128 (+) Transcript_7157:62-445(+)|eukprot:CAMPEP_0179101582 /NCGR_PEP_ID=MMETSP0796-20121207/46974_1 /TAXON_ID=73915 /ORGANISM="Pyrodinium bahamense, Strain pbaha01" /LENGTH=127 /DNA_ID=CAMNT_0020799437 /DNA_START=58 /DNA_END=441 /DNA_ORIENTATION=-
MTAVSIAPQTQLRRRARALAIIAALCAATVACLVPRSVQATREAFAVTPQLGRRSAMMLMGGLVATAGSGGALAMTADEEACLSKCVYSCSGGARGKGEEYKERSICIAKCKDECLPKEEEEELVLS